MQPHAAQKVSLWFNTNQVHQLRADKNDRTPPDAFADMRGWINNTTQLSPTQVNKVLTEAMAICGANQLTRDMVFNAVELANESIRGEFAPG